MVTLPSILEVLHRDKHGNDFYIVFVFYVDLTRSRPIGEKGDLSCTIQNVEFLIKVSHFFNFA